MPKNHIRTLEIKNFKSIRDLKIQCRRINLFVGRPNVGKSNILEALSLHGLCYNDGSFLKNDLYRIRWISDLFFNGNLKENIEVNTDLGKAKLQRLADERIVFSLFGKHPGIELPFTRALNSKKKDIQESIESIDFIKRFFKVKTEIAPVLSLIGKDRREELVSYSEKKSPVKKYDFSPTTELNDLFDLFLRPPFGNNLASIIRFFPGILQEISDMSADKLPFISIDSKSNEIEIKKQLNEIEFFSLPYSSLADTLRRIIFHYSAIESNKNSILLFEEPEAHSFLPFVYMLASKIIDSRTNQFFITTQSPVILNTIIENAPRKDIAVFSVSSKNEQTIASLVPEKTLSRILDYGHDIFFHLQTE